MKLLVIDGNSIVNRAFYGIKLLTTKQGEYTNAIYGFLTILLKLKDICNPDAVVAAFDVHAPTFRHIMYDEYKAGRHGMPDELRSQMPILKELLKNLGIATLEQEGWEADDILGTLAEACRKNGDECFIATGDRDSLQLAHGGVRVLLARTKMGQAVTDVYDEDAIAEEFGVTPAELIQVKALEGDSSDNIPGVAGVGKKTALDLIQRFHNLDYIYENIDDIDIKKGVREKLKNDKEKAYLSLDLGTIRTNAPVNTDVKSYLDFKRDEAGAIADFVRLELFSLIPRFDLDPSAAPVEEEAEAEEERSISRLTCVDADYLLDRVRGKDTYFYPVIIDGSITDLYFSFGDEIIVMPSETPEYSYFVRNFFMDENTKKFSYNTKELHRLACKYGVELKGVAGDLMLSAYLLRPSDSNYDLDHLCLEYGVKIPEFLNSLGEKDMTVAISATVKPLFDKMNKLIADANEESLLNDIELPLSAVLAKMEYAGFEVDKQGIEDFGKMLGERIYELTNAIYESVGHEFNINSPKQLGVALFEDLGLPCRKKTKTGYSTNAEILEELVDVHPAVSQILEYRSLSKLKSTYCDGLLKVIEDDGRIHTRFNQVETRTGRISSVEPNLQNIPIRTDLGREMRKFFIAGEGKKLIDVDYSQIELRVLSDLADDEVMINAFNTGVDIHTLTASQVFDQPVDFVTPQMRSRAKAVNFGIVYGIGAFSLAKDIGVTNKEAKQYIESYLSTYSGVDSYMKRMIEVAKEKGYSETLFHRKRYLPELASSNHMMRSFGERVARNMPIQGTAADIIKIAMVKVDARLKAENMESHLILQVHDELIVESPDNEAEKALQIVTEEMENACKMKVLLRADGNIGNTWYDAH